MPNPALSDQLALQQLFQEPMQPLNTYSQGALAIAMYERQQRQLKEREQALQKIKEQAESERAVAADRRLVEKLKTEHDFKTADAKEKERAEMVKQANDIGAKLPSTATYEEALAAFTTAHGRTLITLNRRAGEAIRDLTQGTGMNGKEFAQRIANEIADSPELSKVLTPKERENIRNNPDKIKDIRSALAKDPKKYEAFTQANKNAVDAVTAAMEKEHASKPSVVAAAGRLKTIYNDMEIERKRAGYRPEDEDAALRAYNEVVYPPQPEAAPQRGQVPRGFGAATIPRPLPMPGGYSFTPPQAAAPAPQTFMEQGLIPSVSGAVGGGLQGISQAVGNVASSPEVGYGLNQVGRFFTGGPEIPFSAYPPSNMNPFAATAPMAAMAQAMGPNATGMPGSPTPPSTLARLRLQKQIQDASAANAALFPQQTNSMLLENP